MPEPQNTQEILNKIRRGDINAFYEFRNFIKQKYGNLDHIIEYGTYELMSTDINEKDIDLFKSFATELNNNHSYLEQNALKGLASQLEAIAIESVAFQQNKEKINQEDIITSRNILYAKNKDAISILSRQEIPENNLVIEALERYAPLAQHETNLLFLAEKTKSAHPKLHEALNRKLLHIGTDEDSKIINEATDLDELLLLEIKKLDLLSKIYQYETSPSISKDEDKTLYYLKNELKKNEMLHMIYQYKTKHTLSDDQKKIVEVMQSALNGTATKEELDLFSRKQSDNAFQSIINFFVQLYNQIFHSETVAEFKAIKKEYQALIQEPSLEAEPKITPINKVG